MEFEFYSKGESVKVMLTVGEILLYQSEHSVFKIVGFDKDKYGQFIITDGENCDGSIKTIRQDNLSYYRYVKGVDDSEAKDLADKIMSGKIDINSLVPLEPTESSTSLMKVDEDYYNRTLMTIEQQKARIEVIRTHIMKKTELMRRDIDSIISAQNKIIRRLNAIVFTLKLYAGINETVKQIQSGQHADDSEPIYLNQLRRYMDEEVGDPSNGGLSFDNIDAFDNWLLKKNAFLKCMNYELLLPQKKSVRIMRVRRTPSEKYTKDIWNNQWEIGLELRTYILIRNGENIYTIDSAMSFQDRLFPNEKELTSIMNETDEDKKFEALEKYKNGMILMQGLIDRTTIFGELYGKVSFLKLESQESGKVVFQYEIDDNNLITDGTKTFLDFLNTDEIKKGDRILINNPDIGYQGERLFRSYHRSSYLPNSPETGIYKLEWSNEYHTLYFKYLPSDNTYSWTEGYTPRKNKISFKIKPSDRNIVNIDRVSHRDLDWIESMFYDRRDRKQYLRVHGLLQALKTYKKIELEEERSFMLLIVQTVKCTELEALDAIHWWKTKNMHKRALSVDDKKAFRMIVKYLKNK